MKTARIVDSQYVNIEDWGHVTQDPLDNLNIVVREAIGKGQKYAGGEVSKTATTKVTVATPTYLFKQGDVYSFEDVNGLEIDLLSQLPISGYKRIIAIVAQGEERNDET